MRWRRTVIALVMVILCMATAAGGWARDGGSKDRMLGKWWHHDRTVARLQLTGEQKDRLDALYAKYRVAFIELRAEVDKSAVRFEQVMESDSFSESDARRCLSEAQQAKDRLDRARMDYLVEVRSILSREQFVTLKKTTEERHQRRQ
ncbi:MAG: periplasmic heavy metal sensor [Deltaproteobacteria bacterium]|nr:periplasmic heavy metal sensor [Candidatus Anaeroferrophillus wilburensis]MBN2889149.1 periplasmic heavy metal sensor [Deltaproteobacteria bacterium]